jgi:transcriptional regulator with XRE-family HTH domain
VTPRRAERTPIAAYADLGRAVLARRIEIDLSRRDVEAAVGFRRGVLRGVENGRKVIGAEMMEPLFGALGLQLVLTADRAEVTCQSYGRLIDCLVARRYALGLTQEAVNHISGLQEGYINKIEVLIRTLGPVSLPALLGALRMQMFVEEVRRFRWRTPEPPIIGTLHTSYIHMPPEVIHSANPLISAGAINQ